jgi:hypothetical protein
VAASGLPTPGLSESGSLPGGVRFVDNGNGTATLGGTPVAGSGGRYLLTITANNGIAPSATQSFTLTVDEAPTITSADGATFRVGMAGTFTVTISHHYPAAALGETGALPGGVSFTDNHDGTATLAGTPTAGGSFSFVITAANGVAPGAMQTFTLTVNPPAIILSPASLPSARVGTSYRQTITAGGGTAPYHSKISSGSLPPGVTLNPDTGSLSGIPHAPGSFRLVVTLTDSSTGTGPYRTSRSFTLKVQQGTPARLIFLTQPDTAAPGGLLAPFRLLVLDLYGNRLSGVVVSLAAVPIATAEPPQFRADSVVRATTVNGVATFGHVSITARGRYALLANAGALDLLSDTFGVGRPVRQPVPVPGLAGDHSAGRQL